MIEDEPKTSTLSNPNAIDRDYIASVRAQITNSALQQAFDSALAEMERLAAFYPQIPTTTRVNFGSQMEGKAAPLKRALTESGVQSVRDIASKIVAMYEEAAGHDRSQYAAYGRR